MSNYSDAQILEARHELWREGDLSWKLGPTQQKLRKFYKQVKNKKRKTMTMNISRQVGKTWWMCVEGIEQCLRQPKSVVLMIQPEQNMCTIQVNPKIEEILEDCPPDLMPKWIEKKSLWEFKNKSVFRLAGTDGGQHKKFRGGKSHLAFVDEAGFVYENGREDLGYIVREVLLPTTQTTGGKIILSSTTPVNEDHAFMGYMQEAEKNGTFYQANVYDAIKDWEGYVGNIQPTISHEILSEIASEFPDGVENAGFKREYLNIPDENNESKVVPDFTTEVQEDTIMPWYRPVFCDKYVAMDVGVRDLTAVLFAYYDFDNGVVVIEDEICMNGPSMTTDVLSQAIKDKEKELWTNHITGETEKPFKRISDNNLFMLNNFRELHGLPFMATDKDDLHAAVNVVRQMVKYRRVIINPKCETLIHHLKIAQWDKDKKKFKKASDNSHVDALAALVYLIRNLNKNHDPYPSTYRRDMIGQLGPHHISEKGMKKYNKNPFDSLTATKSSLAFGKKKK